MDLRLVVDPAFVTLSFPTRYRDDILRALDYFRDAGAPPDPRVDDAVRLLEARRQADGTWLLDGSHDDGLDLPGGEPVGAPSRWNTLRALRVLRWYDAARAPAAAQALSTRGSTTLG